MYISCAGVDPGFSVGGRQLLQGYNFAKFQKKNKQKQQRQKQQRQQQQKHEIGKKLWI